MDDLGGLEWSSRREVRTSLLLLLVLILLFTLLFSSAGRVDEQSVELATKKCSFSEHLRETARINTSNGWWSNPPLVGGVVESVVERKSKATP